MKYDLRLKMVQYAQRHGNKPAAEHFGCQVKTVRLWRRRWEQAGYARSALLDRSRAPKHCPHKTPKSVERQILREREKAPCLGARRLKDFCGIPASEGAIGRILRQAGLTRRRKKKHEKKRDMREVKARFKPFEQAQVDVKYLNDIPFYVEQMWRNKALPRFQYTWRDVKTGAVFLGFAGELSEEHACCFVKAVSQHLKRTGTPLADFATIQTDNGTEFSGAERCVEKNRGFHYTVEQRIRARHRFIPPGKKNYQADVETLHERIEAEFFDIESFADQHDFFNKASAWQLWWNTTRKNSYKHHRAPDQILAEEKPDRNPKTWMLPALDLDQAIRRKKGTGGYYVPALPETTLRNDPPEGHVRGLWAFAHSTQAAKPSICGLLPPPRAPYQDPTTEKNLRGSA